jgi:two-component system, chemotaxis family, sensor kinase Cph1
MLTSPVQETWPSAAEAECDREPIHIPGTIQPHGFLLVVREPELTVLQTTENVEQHLGRRAEGILNSALVDVIGPELALGLVSQLDRIPRLGRPILLKTAELPCPEGSRLYHVIGHRSPAGTVLEFEVAPDASTQTDIHAFVDAFTLGVESVDDIGDMARLACEEVQRLTGFDRVLIYQFDEDWNGTVIGEAGTGRLPSLLDHRFPASDIPAPARELYRINRLRIIPDAGYEPVPIVPSQSPLTGEPLDLTFSVLRSVSPVHVEYMRNMGTASSMSVSILRDGRLWGLVSCHHREPKIVSFPIRVTCDLFARAFSLRLSALEHSESYQRRIEVQSAYTDLLAAMANRGDFGLALSERPRELLGLTGATGAALLTAGQCVLVGDTPTESECRSLADWLLQTQQQQDVFATDALPGHFPEGQSPAPSVTGLLAIGVSRIHASYILWFRPELLRTVRWGGNPEKRIELNNGTSRLHPRRSFETWIETVRGRSLPWSEQEVEAARSLRNAIVDIVLRKAEELAELTAELKRSNQELESFSYSVSHDLRAPLRHIVGYAELLRESLAGKASATESRCIANIIDSSEYAGKLVDKLLSYSRLGRAELQRTRIDLNLLMDEIRRDVMRDAVGREVRWTLGPLPTVVGDLMMLRMAFRDLAANAVKYTRNRSEALIEVAARDEESSHVIWVADNGVGFDMQYADKLFGVFQRLHRWEDFEGTGIGLANVRRVVERHGGETWATGEVNGGATFFVRLPKAIPID